MSDLTISSTSNPRVKRLVRLRSRRHRDEEGRFIIEGYRELTRAVAAGVEIEEVGYCPGLFLGSNESALLSAAETAGARLVEYAEEPFRKVSYRDRPEGLIALARQFPTRLDDLSLTDAPLVLAVEAIEKPGNLGTMLRTADAAGVDAVIACDPTTDPFNPNVVRASLGCLFVVPVAIASSDETAVWLKRRGVRLFATTPSADLPYWDVHYSGGCAIAIGSEQYGLSDTLLSAADEQIRIPMRGEVDSLNAAMAAGVVLYEAVRQRRRQATS
jgi:TrmH family RNA methyltransferase